MQFIRKKMLNFILSVIFLTLFANCKQLKTISALKRERVTFFSDTEEHPYFQFRLIDDYKEFDKLKIGGRNMYATKTLDITRGVSEDPYAIEVTFKSGRNDYGDPTFVQDGNDFYFFYQYSIGSMAPTIEIMKQEGGNGDFERIAHFSISENYVNRYDFLIKDKKIYFKYNERDKDDNDDSHFLLFDLEAMTREELFVARGKTQLDKTVIEFQDKILFVGEYGTYEFDPSTKKIKTLIEFNYPSSPNDLRVYQNQFYFSYQDYASSRKDFVYDGNNVAESKIPFSTGHLVGNRIYRDGSELSYFDIDKMVEVPIKFNCTQYPFAKKCVILNTEDPKRIVFGVSYTNRKEEGNRLFYTDGTNVEEILTIVIESGNLTTTHIGSMTINGDYLFVGATDSSTHPLELSDDYLYVIHIPSKEAVDVSCVCKPYEVQYLTEECDAKFPLFSSDNYVYYIQSSPEGSNQDRHREDLYMYRL